MLYAIPVKSIFRRTAESLCKTRQRADYGAHSVPVGCMGFFPTESCPEIGAKTQIIKSSPVLRRCRLEIGFPSHEASAIAVASVRCLHGRGHHLNDDSWPPVKYVAKNKQTIHFQIKQGRDYLTRVRKSWPENETFVRYFPSSPWHFCINCPAAQIKTRHNGCTSWYCFVLSQGGPSFISFDR